MVTDTDIQAQQRLESNDLAGYAACQRPSHASESHSLEVPSPIGADTLPMLQRFIESFHRAVTGEMESMRKRMGP